MAYRPPYINFFTGGVQTGCGSRAGGRPVLLPRRPEGLHRPRVLRRAARALRRARRFRAGLRDRTRARPPRPDLLGIDAQVRRAQQRPGRSERLSVRLELQADCFAGVWGPTRATPSRRDARARRRRGGARRRRGRRRRPHPAVGQRSREPETWTHGSAEQREPAFRHGFRHRRPQRLLVLRALPLDRVGSLRRGPPARAHDYEWSDPSLAGWERSRVLGVCDVGFLAGDAGSAPM